ncbi:MAG: hypothetical protein EBY20_00640 [Alphaproteobacteria bacterium]|nr:hypothetical protein [Alphaproteobacteria bacterium]
MDKKKVKWNDWIEWKWTNGEKYEKSPRQPRRGQQNQNQSQIDYEDEDPSKMANLAFQQALLSENDVWSLEEQQVFVNPEKPMNKREDTYNRMAEREMVGQIGMNPFMQRNYLEDVMVQENFLKPVSTSLEREKFNEK